MPAPKKIENAETLVIQPTALDTTEWPVQPPEIAYEPIVVERSSGQLATAYLHAGGLLWVYDEAEVPAGAVALYQRSTDG